LGLFFGLNIDIQGIAALYSLDLKSGKNVAWSEIYDGL